MKVSKVAANIPESPTLAITAKVNELKSQGKNVIGFGAGEPDFDTPDPIKDVTVDSLKKGNTKYTPVAGTLELREAVCATILADYGLKYSPASVIVSCGAKHSLYNLFYALFEAPDEVLVPGPCWVSYPPMIEMTGAKAVVVDTRQNSMHLTADMVKEAITPRTRGIVINSPSNPTGMVFKKKELEKIAELCVEHDMAIISDDIYRKLVFDGSEFFSVATISPEVAKRTFIIDGPSKTYAMTGWRIGYCIGDTEVIKAMSRLQSQSTSNPTSFAQKGAAVSLTGDQTIVEERRKIFQKRRDLIVSKLKEIPGFSIIPPEGSFYAFPSIEGWMDRFGGSTGLTSYLLENALVAVVPGEEFGAPDHLRVSFATSDENIINGLDRVKVALAKL